MMSYLQRRVEGVLSAPVRLLLNEDSTWITVIETWLCVVFCAYVAIGLSLLGWILLG